MTGPIKIILYNSLDVDPDGRTSNMLPVNFLKLILEYFGHIEEDSVHQNIIKKECKIYCYRLKTLSPNSELMIVGSKGVKEIIKLAKNNNWSVLHPTQNGLTNLGLMNNETINSYLDKTNT